MYRFRDSRPLPSAEEAGRDQISTLCHPWALTSLLALSLLVFVLCIMSRAFHCTDRGKRENTPTFKSASQQTSHFKLRLEVVKLSAF